jgi:hypothetical protein
MRDAHMSRFDEQIRNTKIDNNLKRILTGYFFCSAEGY